MAITTTTLDCDQRQRIALAIIFSLIIKAYLNLLYMRRFFYWISLPRKEVLCESIKDISTEHHILLCLSGLRTRPSKYKSWFKIIDSFQASILLK